MTDIKERINGRKRAEELFALLAEDASSLSECGRAAFWESVSSQLIDVLPVSSQPEANSDQPMSDKSAAIYGRETVFPFGKYAGQRVDEVPIDYLAMLVDDNDFKKQLRRYLRSERIQREQE